MPFFSPGWCSAEIYALKKEEGGRHTPIQTGYRPQFFSRTADITGSLVLPEDKPVSPHVATSPPPCELIQPQTMNCRQCTLFGDCRASKIEFAVSSDDDAGRQHVG